MGPIEDANSVRLNEFDKTEWWDVYRRFFPGADEAEYEREWAKFQRMKAEHEAKRSIQ